MDRTPLRGPSLRASETPPRYNEQDLGKAHENAPTLKTERSKHKD